MLWSIRNLGPRRVESIRKTNGGLFPKDVMGHVTRRDIVYYLFGLEYLPYLTRDEENNLTNDEQASRQAINAKIERLQRIANNKINHADVSMWMIQSSFHATTRGRSVDGTTIPEDERNTGRKRAMALANFRTEMVQYLHIVLESPMVSQTMKAEISLNMSRLVN